MKGISIESAMSTVDEIILIKELHISESGSRMNINSNIGFGIQVR